MGVPQSGERLVYFSITRQKNLHLNATIFKKKARGQEELISRTQCVLCSDGVELLLPALWSKQGEK